ncbi:MAG TPA: hypothetical protein VNU71_14625 [Burkholderiaceae bacterium]|nr:hypothetical protein [Burkholderiaceae bacterium]
MSYGHRKFGRRCPRRTTILYFDGGGIGNSGPSTTDQTTETNDMRVVGAEGSINTSTKIDIAGSGNTLMTTDHGAVAGSLQLAGDTVHDAFALTLAGIDKANAITSQTVAANGTLLTGALKMSADQQEQTIDTIKDLKSADVRTLAMVGIAVVGLAAVTLFKKAA